MRRNPERVTWFVLIVSFITFCAIVVSVPLGVRAYLYNTTETMPTHITSIRVTVLAKPFGDDQPLPLTRGTSIDLDELTIITTDDTSQATLSFFDGSDVTLYNNTLLILHSAYRPRFSMSPNSALMSLEVVRGRIRINVAPQNGTSRRFVAKTPYAEVDLQAGSFAIETNNRQSFITAREGAAQVTANQQTIAVAEGEMTMVETGQPPAAPISAEQNLLVNGDFSRGFNTIWEPAIYVPSDHLTSTIVFNSDSLWRKIDVLNHITSTIEAVPVGRRTVVKLSSAGTNNIHTEAGIRQSINKDVQDFRSLRVNAFIRLNHQSLLGGGQLGTEFPIMLEIGYRDVNGNDRIWYHGFYYEPPPSSYILYNTPDNSSESISHFLWYPYESENLLARTGPDKPAYIKYIRIYASGWIYDAMITDIKLLAED